MLLSCCLSFEFLIPSIEKWTHALGTELEDNYMSISNIIVSFLHSTNWPERVRNWFRQWGP